MTGILSLTIFSFLLGCDTEEEVKDTGFISCTSNIEFSVYVTIYDEAGEVIENAAPTISIDGGDDISCEEDSIGGHYCGEDIPGEVTISVSVDGYEPAEETVTVGEDECHVIMEIVDITLVPSE